ncbi:uncharacterized protein K452DRAFT_317362 [Aplosporella prunicola CBS 121167]|uniref:Arrestin-like N-terminal domain-containing protein n=1 Tax=Aplosporella prunicola CBS 121167 TaxID=1176127 RepID=A0A6A6BJY0_9PEZI|nr:uncharacterized protein K452DRAFT_317362 [Aplosporella prunicola CBS 121167]KAF2143127.1 hypothetical protein K452DRAFT_317362 [Aplosporella prunicola CBS 121167]
MASDSDSSPIQIVVDGKGTDWDTAIYTSNDPVHGHVLIDTRLKPSSVTICFSGKAISQVQDIYGLVNTAESVLFSYETTLLSSSESDIPASESSSSPFATFPFEFRFPSSVQSDGRNLKDNPIFAREPGHPLPPSMGASHFPSSGNAAYNAPTLGPSVYALKQVVNYALEAELRSTKSFKLLSGTKKTTTYIRYLPSCASPSHAILNRRTVTMTRQSRRLDPTHAGTHSLRAKLKDIIPSASAPTATFALLTTTPATLRANHPLAATLRLEHKARAPGLPGPPTLRLRGFRVLLKALTHARVPYDGTTQPFSDELVASDACGIPLAVRRWGGVGEEEGVLLREGEEVQLASLAEDGRLEVGAEVAPSFKTYGLAREYELVVRLWVECAGKVYDVEASKFGVEVLSLVGGRGREAREGRVGEGGVPGKHVPARDDSPSAAVLQWNDDDDDDNPPPLYEDIVNADHHADGGKA